MSVIDKLRTALNERYRIEREVGVGGMATVYLARDLRHDRDVAIKVLHPDLAAALGSERFLSEIKTTAKLQHPHILPLLDSGAADGVLYYVMPYVSGESLRTRLERETQLAVDDAVRIAREVLSALESAHKQGVVHRDIKPENILIHEDQALVTDFGIALAVSAAGGPRMTQTGLSLGTPQYMSPEQAMGERAIDARADIYATGAVLYEMLVGEPPFTGPTVQAIVARVMTESARSLTSQRRSVPANVNAAVLRAVEKLPADRFHSAAEFSQALVTPGFTRDEKEITAGESRSKRSLLRIPLLPWAIAGAAVVAAIVFAVRGARPGVDTKPMFLSVDLPPVMELPAATNYLLAISDDGTTLAIGGIVNGQEQIALRRLDQDSYRIVDGSAGARGSVAFSPDGKWLLFQVDTRIFKTLVKGGPSTQIATSNWAQMAWLGNDAIIYTKNYDTGLYKMSADGAGTVALTNPDRKKGELGHWWPQVLPDGDHVLFTNYTTPADQSKIEVLSLKDGKRQPVLEGAYFGRYVDGHLVFVRNRVIMTVGFDLASLHTSGSPQSTSLDVETRVPNGWAGFVVASNGTLAYRTEPLRNIQLMWSDANGNEEPAIDSAARYTGSRPSPDLKKIAVIRDGDVWIYDRQRTLFTRLTDTEQMESDLLWSPDSRYIYYNRDVPQYDIFRRAVDGSTTEERVVTSSSDKDPASISPDGRTLVYWSDINGDNDIFTTSANPQDHASSTMIIGGPGRQANAEFSPDGSWLIYTSNESGRPEIYLAPYPINRGPARQQISIGGGEGADWSADGRSIFYNQSSRLFRVRVNPQAGEIGKPELLSKLQTTLGWDAARDGRFLIARTAKASERHSIKVILNWPATLRDTTEH
jgi:serine/threonine-protein kinase